MMKTILNFLPVAKGRGLQNFVRVCGLAVLGHISGKNPHGF